MDDKLKEMQENYAEQTKGVKDEYEAERKLKLREILLAPLKALKRFAMFISDTVTLKFLIPKEDRTDMVKEAMERAGKLEAEKAYQSRRPDAKSQELKEEVIKNEELDEVGKIRGLCELCMQSGKDITLALKDRNLQGPNPNGKSVPDAVLVFERMGDSVQISYAEKELKTKNAEPSYNFAVRGGINYDEKGEPTFESLNNIVSILKGSYVPDMDKIYIDKATLKTESSRKYTAGTGMEAPDTAINGPSNPKNKDKTPKKDKQHSKKDMPVNDKEEMTVKSDGKGMETAKAGQPDRENQAGAFPVGTPMAGDDGDHMASATPSPQYYNNSHITTYPDFNEDFDDEAASYYAEMIGKQDGIAMTPQNSEWDEVTCDSIDRNQRHVPLDTRCNGKLLEQVLSGDMQDKQAGKDAALQARQDMDIYR